MNKGALYGRRLSLILPIAGGYVLLLIFGISCSSYESIETSVALQPQTAVDSPGPPTTLRLVLQLKDEQIILVSAAPRRGTVTKSRIDMARLLEGKSVLVGYRGLNAAGQELSTGIAVIPLTAQVEFQHLQDENRLQAAEETLFNPVVKVSIPFRTDMTAVQFSRLEPEPRTDMEQWKHLPMNTVKLPKDYKEPPNAAQ